MVLGKLPSIHITTRIYHTSSRKAKVSTNYRDQLSAKRYLSLEVAFK